MRLAYFSATHLRATPSGEAEYAKRLQLLQRYASPGTTFALFDNPGGPLRIEQLADEFQSVPGTLENVKLAESQGFDGGILGCFGDPGLDAAREIAGLPLVAPCVTSIHVAAQLGQRFSVLSPVPSTVPFTRKLVLDYGLGERLASVRAVCVPVLEIRQDRAGAVAKAAAVARQCVELDGADTLVLGCMSMAYQGMDADLAAAVGVPVVNPVAAAVRTLELLVAAGLRPSPKVYKL